MPATQAAHQTDPTDHDWQATFLAVILVASLHLLDVLLKWHANNLPDAIVDSESSANGLQKCQISLAKCSSGQSIRVISSLQS